MGNKCGGECWEKKEKEVEEKVLLLLLVVLVGDEPGRRRSRHGLLLSLLLTFCCGCCRPSVSFWQKGQIGHRISFQRLSIFFCVQIIIFW